MQIYLPIAEVSVNALLLLGLGGVVGLLSGLLGVGGGFLITPLLLFIGIPPPVAVATGANQVVASSVSGVLAHLKRKTVDMRMGAVLVVSGLLGSSAGVWLFNYLSRLGQIDLVVELLYVGLLGVIGGMMLQESIRSLWRTRKTPGRISRHQHMWVHRLPFKMKFRASGLYISVIPPLAIGFAVGVLAALTGIGGGFIIVPAMIYILNMPTKVVTGTSLFQIIFVSGYTTFMHAYTNQSVDLLLAIMLILGGVIGAQIGAGYAMRLKPEQLRLLLALLVIAVCVKLALGLLIEPAELYSLGEAGA